MPCTWDVPHNFNKMPHLSFDGKISNSFQNIASLYQLQDFFLMYPIFSLYRYSLIKVYCFFPKQGESLKVQLHCENNM